MIEAIAFDAYGTLFDVYSVGALAEDLFPGNGKAVSELWRDKQIEYTRLRSMSSVYKPFGEVTEDALVYTCRKLKLTLTTEAKNALMNQYNLLPAFQENIDVLRDLRSMGIKLAILRLAKICHVDVFFISPSHLRSILSAMAHIQCSIQLLKLRGWTEYFHMYYQPTLLRSTNQLLRFTNLDLMHSICLLEKSYSYQATAGMPAVQLGSGMDLTIHFNEY